MMTMRARALALVMLQVTVVAAVGCKKEGRATDNSDLPPALQPRPAKTDVSKIAVPALFASVPADTPYLFGALAPIPEPFIDFYGRAKLAMAPLFAQVASQIQDARGENKVLDAILTEMDGKWSAAGIESLGFSARPVFAVYGLGLQPLVARVAVKDHKAVQATIERIAARAGEQLPPVQTHNGRSYWKITKPGGEGAAVFALADNQVIAAVGKAPDIEANLGLILGSELPKQNMADGAELKAMMTRHGFGPSVIGFGDTKRISLAAAKLGGVELTPTCSAEIDRLAGRVPRAVMGYGEISDEHMAAGMVVEVAPDLVTELRALQTAIPGLRDALSGEPAMAMSVAVDLTRGQKLAVAAADAFGHLGEVCAVPSLKDGAASAREALSRPLPEPLGRITGGAIAVRSIEFGPAGGNGMPTRADGVTVIAAPDGKALFAKLGELMPPLAALGIQADGKTHDVAAMSQVVPFAIAAGVGDRAIVIAAGEQRAALGDKMLAAPAGSKAPLFAMTYDYGKLIDLEMKAIAAASPEMDKLTGAMAGIRSLLRRGAMTFDVSDAGIAMWANVDLAVK